MNNTHGPTKTETIRQMDGKPIATIKTNPQTGVKTVYDNLGNYKGKYDPRKNVTYDNKGSPVSRGNSLDGVATDNICAKGVGSVCHPVAVLSSSYRPRNAVRLFQVVPAAYYPRGLGRRW